MSHEIQCFVRLRTCTGLARHPVESQLPVHTSGHCAKAGTVYVEWVWTLLTSMRLLIGVVVDALDALLVG